MNSFTFYLKLGYGHIISLGALDHLLFLVALISIYMITDWKRVLVLVTAFTLGHSVTLALSVMEWIRFRSEWVEFLIPITILVTCTINLLLPEKTEGNLILKYLLACGFGLIHGLGFANNIRFILAEDESLLTSLLAFNLGLEVGQIGIVIILLLISYLILELIRLRPQYWNVALNAAPFSVALWITLHRLPFN